MHVSCCTKFGAGISARMTPDVRRISVPKTSSLGWFCVLEFGSFFYLKLELSACSWSLFRKKGIHHHRGNPLFVQGLGPLWCIPFPDLWYTLVPCFPKEMVYTMAGFCWSVTSGSGDRPREKGCHNDGVHSLFFGFCLQRKVRLTNTLTDCNPTTHSDVVSGFRALLLQSVHTKSPEYILR